MAFILLKLILDLFKNISNYFINLLFLLLDNNNLPILIILLDNNNLTILIIIYIIKIIYYFII